MYLFNIQPDITVFICNLSLGKGGRQENCDHTDIHSESTPPDSVRLNTKIAEVK